MEDEKFVSPCPPPEGEDREILTILIEECMEVSQRGTKALRFGLEEVQPGQDLSNMQRISDEIGDLFAVYFAMEELGLVDHKCVDVAISRKKKKLEKYMQSRNRT
jgi:NTP pyrophosphatase (non-canonical NTP hydrolase)